MKMIDEIRRDNLRVLEKAAGSMKSLAESVGVSESQMSQWVNGSPDSKTGKPRGIRAESCRRIEKAAGRHEGWLDMDHSEQESMPNAKSEDAPSQAGRNDVTIDRFNTGGVMGHGGLDLPEQPGVIESWRVSREWLQKNIPSYTSVDNLCLVTGFGDSMRPMFNSGDPLVVDRGVRSIKFDGVYFFRVEGEGFIKRLQRIPTEDGMVFRAKSENTAYEAWDITKKMDFEVFGRVLKVWRSEDF